MPENGVVSIFFLTDRQFGMTKNFFGGLKVEIKAHEQGILLFKKKSLQTGGILRQRRLFRIIP